MRNNNKKAEAKGETSVIDLFDLESPYVTEYRRLLYRLQNSDRGKELKSILITSALTGEGKSTVCAFLAMTASMKKGLKTLVIDADLRLPTIHKLFAMNLHPGLIEVLARGEDPKKAIRKTKVDGLDVLTAGTHGGNPTEVFDAEAIGRLVDDLKFYYDLIILDCSPVLPVSDPMLLASQVDAVIMVVKTGETQKEVAQRALAILDPRKNNILGAVLNNMNHTLPYYYNYDYYRYDYHQSGKGKTSPGNTPPTVESGPAQEKQIINDKIIREN
ncbi:MAG: CpsD/CapB family tyrosine-protein kinase [Candidatus Zixiibacteriota bacterium]